MHEVVVSTVHKSPFYVLYFYWVLPYYYPYIFNSYFIFFFFYCTCFFFHYQSYLYLFVYIFFIIYSFFFFSSEAIKITLFTLSEILFDFLSYQSPELWVFFRKVLFITFATPDNVLLFPWVIYMLCFFVRFFATTTFTTPDNVLPFLLFPRSVYCNLTITLFLLYLIILYLAYQIFPHTHWDFCDIQDFFFYPIHCLMTPCTLKFHSTFIILFFAMPVKDSHHLPGLRRSNHATGTPVITSPALSREFHMDPLSLHNIQILTLQYRCNILSYLWLSGV